MCNNGKCEKAQTKLMFGLERKLDVKVGYTHHQLHQPTARSSRHSAAYFGHKPELQFYYATKLEEFLMIHIKVTFIFYFFVFCQYHVHKN